MGKHCLWVGIPQRDLSLCCWSTRSTHPNRLESLLQSAKFSHFGILNFILYVTIIVKVVSFTSHLIWALGPFNVRMSKRIDSPIPITVVATTLILDIVIWFIYLILTLGLLHSWIRLGVPLLYFCKELLNKVVWVVRFSFFVNLRFW